MDEVRRHGVALVWEEGHTEVSADQLHATFGPFDVEGALQTARLTWHPVHPIRIHYAFVAPRRP